MTVEHAITSMQEAMRQALRKYVGLPAQLHVVMGAVRAALLELEAKHPDFFQPHRELFVEIGMLAFGFGNPAKICRILKALPTYEIDWLHLNLGDGPAGMIGLEWSFRHDGILGWNCTQERVGPEGLVHLDFYPKEPVNYVKIDFTLEDKP